MMHLWISLFAAIALAAPPIDWKPYVQLRAKAVAQGTKAPGNDKANDAQASAVNAAFIKAIGPVRFRDSKATASVHPGSFVPELGYCSHDMLVFNMSGKNGEPDLVMVTDEQLFTKQSADAKTWKTGPALAESFWCGYEDAAMTMKIPLPTPTSPLKDSAAFVVGFGQDIAPVAPTALLYVSKTKGLIAEARVPVTLPESPTCAKGFNESVAKVGDDKAYAVFVDCYTKDVLTAAKAKSLTQQLEKTARLVESLQRE